MKILGIIQWEKSHQAVALCYATTYAELTDKVLDTKIAAGSIAYTSEPCTYVFDGEEWVEM